MQVGELIAQRYRAEATLGEGGMGQVWRAHDLRLDRSVAVKLLTDRSDPASHTRFVREARSMARLSHPNLATVHDTGEFDGRAYLVMELVDGAPLDEVLRRRGRLPYADVRAIGADIAAALAAVHAAGIVHRDIKPANLIQDPTGRVRLVDFGIARELDDDVTRLTQLGMLVGTPAYVAPEQIETGRSTPSSDMYALGCVLYELPYAVGTVDRSCVRSCGPVR